MPLYEILVRVVDKTSSDPLIDAKCRKRGDVIAYKLASRAWWTERERTNPAWTIITADLTHEMAQSLKGPHLPPDLSREYKMLHRRGVKIDLDILGDTSQPINRGRIIAAIKVKERRPEPDELVPPRSLTFR